MFSSNRELRYKSKSSLKLPGINSKSLQMDFTLFIRTTRWCEKWWQHKKLCEASSIFKLQEHKRFKQSWKLCRNLCSLSWLRLNLRWVRNVKPFGSKILYLLNWTRWLKGSNLLFNIKIGSEFLMLRSKLNQSFSVEGKKVVETICSAVKGSWN